MKAKEILNPEEIDENDCHVCKLHEKAYKKLKNKVICPYCGSENDEPFEFVVVGESNRGDKNEEIRKLPVFDCACGEYYYLEPTKLIYNGNHDIYYTGGKDYLTDDIKGIGEAIFSDIEEYTKRLLKGEKLTAINLKTWIEYKIEHCVAKYLFEKGFKK